MQKLFTDNILLRLTQNAKQPNVDHVPVVKIFTPDADCTWLFTELDTDGRLFGWCDLGMGFPELGYVFLAEILETSGQLGLPIERDAHWTATGTLTQYADAARKAERIVNLPKHAAIAA